MSYLVLARKYRPGGFDSVSGQEHVTRTLQNSLKRDRIAHAYLFAGPRGVGKTSIARIFSKALNCKEGEPGHPCQECSNCLEITAGTSLAVREIDGASHNSVDNVRELIDSFRSLPPPGYRYKIYIIDEVHMLSISAFNALLKSLEEPPPNTVFILATTDVHKIPETVISRCQRHDLRALSGELVEGRLKYVAESEGMTVEPEVFKMIARLSEGSMRDAQSLLDRVSSFCEGVVTAQEASKVLGAVEKSLLFKLSKAIFGRDSGEALSLLDFAFSSAVDASLFLREFATHWRELLLAKFGHEKALARLGLRKEDSLELLSQVQEVDGRDIEDLVTIAREGADTALRSFHPRYSFESLVVRMAEREPVRSIGDILGRIERGIGKVPPGGGGGGGEGRTARTSTRESRVTDEPQERRESATQVAPSSSSVAPVPPATRSSAVSSSPVPSTPPPLEWEGFVQFVANNTNFLSEYLKALSVRQFEQGVLEAEGASFYVQSVEARRDKLGELLEKFSGQGGWRIMLRNGASKEAPQNTLLDLERKREEERKRRKQEDLANYPTIQNLRESFPGSKIESIKRKTPE